MFRRTILVLALSASPAAAEPLIFYGGGGQRTTNVLEPAKLAFHLFTGTSLANQTLIEDGEIRGVTPGNGMVWVINESNAATYDFDWAAAEEGVLRRSNVGFGATLMADDGGSVAGTGTPATDFLGGPFNFRSNPFSTVHLVVGQLRLGMFNMSEIQIHMSYWALPDNLRLRQGSYSTEWIIVGEGTYVPEPSSLILMLVSAVVALPIGGRGKRLPN